MRSGISIVIAVLLAMGTAAAAPEIANVAGPVNHWEPFLVFGEGFDEPESTVIAWAPKGASRPQAASAADSQRRVAAAAGKSRPMEA